MCTPSQSIENKERLFLLPLFSMLTFPGREEKERKQERAMGKEGNLEEERKGHDVGDKKG